jgi:glycosyltransferase involved in cell wall biosynthesis
MRILVIFETLPLPDGGGADHRLMQVIGLLCEQGHAVTFLAPRSNGTAGHAAPLKTLGVEVQLDDSDVLRAEGTDIASKWTLQELLGQGQFDLAIISLWFWMGVTLPEHYLDAIRQLSPETRIAILTDDCHGIRELGGAEISGLWSDRERAVDFSERESEAYRRSDLVICISHSDREKIAQAAPGVPIEVLPMMIETPPSAPIPDFDSREGIVYLGHFNNPPTLDGLEWYIREIAPFVYEKLPHLKLYLVGAGLPADWTSPDPNLVRVGFQHDLAGEFGKRRVLISPVRFGTGVKTKNLHALANGLPVVTNSKGADGANFISGKNAFVRDDPRAFADAVIRLCTDAALWNQISENSRAHAEQYFSKSRMDSALSSILGRAVELSPKSYDPEHVWSVRLVENLFADVLNYHPAHQRRSIRVIAHARAAEQLLAQDDGAGARRQLRHVFNYFSHTVSRNIFFTSFAKVAQSMDRTYRALGESEGADEFCREARTLSSSVFPEPSPGTQVRPVAATSARESEGLHPAVAPSVPACRTAEIMRAPAQIPVLAETAPQKNAYHP